ncbi:DNA polymerase V subunit UmuD [compost metagenome]
MDELVGLREPSRWLVRADGESLVEMGVFDRDIMVVDKALAPIDGDVVVVVIGPDFVAKQYCERPGKAPLLLAHNKAFPNIEVGDWEEIELWGVVLFNLHRVSRR